jgi:hypothetical protein
MSGISAVSPPMRAQSHSARSRNTLDKLSDSCRLKFINRKIIEEEQRLCSHHEHIVDVHRDKVEADRVKSLHITRDEHFVPTPSVQAASTGFCNSF